MNELADKIDFATWRGTTRLAENLFVRNFFLPSPVIPQWEIRRDREVPVHGMLGARFSYLGARTGATAIAVESYEHRSRTAAHEGLVELFGQFESPILPSREPDVGDVAFGVSGGQVILFARANLVLKVRRAERDAAPVRELASVIDALIIAKDAPSAVSPRMRLAIRDRERIVISMGGPPKLREMTKVFGRGEIFSDEKGDIIYRPATQTDEPLILSIDESGSPMRVQLQGQK